MHLHPEIAARGEEQRAAVCPEKQHLLPFSLMSEGEDGLDSSKGPQEKNVYYLIGRIWHQKRGFAASRAWREEKNRRPLNFRDIKGVISLPEPPARGPVVTVYSQIRAGKFFSPCGRRWPRERRKAL